MVWTSHFVSEGVQPAIYILAAGHLSCVTLSLLTDWRVAKRINGEVCLR